jgi:hypothetical protein
MGATLPKPPSGQWSGNAFCQQILSKSLQGIGAWVQCKSENRNLAKMARGDGRRLVLLQTLRTRDPDDLAEGFRRWDLRFRRLGGGSFRGELQSLQLGATQILRASGTRRLQARGGRLDGEASENRHVRPVQLARMLLVCVREGAE